MEKIITNIFNTRHQKLSQNINFCLYSIDATPENQNLKILLKNWRNAKNKRQYFEKIAKVDKIKYSHQWYSVPIKQIYKHGHSRIIDDEYGSHLFFCLTDLWPDINWEPWKFSRVPERFWESIENQKQYFKYLEKKLNIKSMEDWYTVPSKKLGSIYVRYNSLQKLFETIYPEQTWIPWKFSQVPEGYFDVLKNQQHYFKYLAEELNIKSMDDWYHISPKKIQASIYNQYYSMKHLLCNIYPNKIWYHWKFKIIQENLWYGKKGKYNRRQMIEETAKVLNVYKTHDWYKITLSKLLKTKLPRLVDLYNTNTFYLVSDLIPEISWIAWNFPQVPHNYWESEQNCLFFLEWCEKYFKMKSKKEWYFVTVDEIRKLSPSILLKYSGCYHLLSHFYPNENWQKSEFKKLRNGGKSQFKLSKTISNLFPDKKLFINYKHPNLFFENSKKKIELDIYLPSVNIAFEYQGQQHYQQLEVWSDLGSQQKRDLEKRILCKNNSITLIEIPFSWDQKKSTLKKIIQEVRPDILL